MGLRFVWILFFTASLAAPALAQSADVWFERGRTALAEDRPADALAAFDAAADKDRAHAEAQYARARLYLTDAFLHPEAAKQALRRALKEDPENVRYLELDLWRRFRHDKGFLPTYGTLRRAQKAEYLLERDPGNAIAHYVLGVTAYHDYRALRHAREVPNLGRMQTGFSAEESLIQRIPFSLDIEYDPSDATAGLQFFERQLSGRRLDLTPKTEAATAAYAEAEAHLRAALDADPARRTTYTFLVRLYALAEAYDDALPVLATLRTRFPDDPDTDLYAGFIAYQRGDYAAAETHFAGALGRLAVADRRAFEDVTYFLDNEAYLRFEMNPEAARVRFWAERDPRLMTPLNERRLEHFARLVYADLRFGAMFEDMRGWESEPGKVIVRYGLPPAEAQFSNMTDTYLLWHYGDKQFAFMDLVKTEQLTFYSPSAVQFVGARNVSREWAHDYAVVGPETFRKIPEESAFAPPERVAFPYLASVFKGEAGTADVYVPFGVPVPPAAEGPLAFAFALDAAAFVLDADARPRATARHTTPMGTGGRVFAFEEATMWIDTHHLAVPPGAYTLAVEFETEGGAAGLGFDRTDLAVPDFGGADLRLSDVMLAYAIEEAAPEAGATAAPGHLRRDGLSIVPAPWGVFAHAQPLYLYFEAYNLARAPDGTTRYDVEAVLVRAEAEKRGLDRLIDRAFGRGGAGGVSARFEGTGTAPDEGQYLILDAATETPGPYILAVRVHDRVRATTAEARRTLVLE